MFENLDIKYIILGILVIFTIYLIYKTRNLSEHFSTSSVSIETQINDFFKSDFTGLRKLGPLINNITNTNTNIDPNITQSVQVNNLYIDTMDASNLDDSIIFNIPNLYYTIITLDNKKYALGQIVMWSGTISSIPNGWVLCDGNNGTIDLRGKFILGGIKSISSSTSALASSSSSSSSSSTSQNNTYKNTTASNGLTIRYVGEQGGEEKHKITIDELPKHTHQLLYGVNIRSSGIKGQDQYGGTSSNSYLHDGLEYTGVNNNNPSSQCNGSNNTTCSPGLAHENMPPYYALFFIQKINLLNE
jgi:microcystin-dependent protein